MDLKDVDNLAELARIQLSDKEKNSLLKDMQDILGYIQMIQSAKLEDSSEEHTLINVFREDILATREFSPELILEQFPDTKDNFLKVKKIL
jgi:aspartyl-tRNA(Asn)/glutamyl-tRNA(Gln) amidotransferase subunit C